MAGRIQCSVYLLFVIFAGILPKVLTVDQQKPIDASQRWFEKNWTPTRSSDNDPDSLEDTGLMHSMPDEIGSGAEPMSDLEDIADGIGEDDEDAGIDVGSGDISLPSVMPPSPASTHSTVGSTSRTMSEVDSDLYAVHVVPDVGTSTRKAMIASTHAKGTGKKNSSAIGTGRTALGPKKNARPTLTDGENKPSPTNFWMRPGVLAGLIGGAIAGLLAAILLVMFVVYRMRKKDEGSYAMDEPKPPPSYPPPPYAYQKAPTREFYA